MKKLALIASALFLSAASASAANIVETASSAGTFKTLLAAAQAAGLAEALSTTQTKVFREWAMRQRDKPITTGMTNQAQELPA